MTSETWQKEFGEYLIDHHITSVTPNEVAHVGKANGLTRLQAPPRSLWANAVKLAKILDWLRDRSNTAPIIIEAWYRDPAFNASLGKRKNSFHTLCAAANINKAGWKPRKTALILLEHPLASKLGIGLYDDYVHVDIRGMLGFDSPAYWGAEEWWKDK